MKKKIFYMMARTEKN